MKRKIVGLVILFFIFAIFLAVGSNLDRELQNTDEGIYLTVASEMVEHNTWFKATYHHSPYFNKLPFAIWPSKIALMLFDFKDVGYRGMQLFIGLLGAIAVFFTARKFTKNYIIALLSAMLLLTMRQFVAFLIDVKMDNLLLLFQILALLFLYCWYEKYQNDKKNYGYPLLFATSLAFAFLTKTVMSVLVPIIFFVFLLLKNDLKFIIKQKKQIGISIALFFAIVGIFFAFYVTKENYGSIFRSLFLTEIKNRALNGYHNQEQEFYYLNIVLGGRFFFPLLVFFPTLGYALYLVIKKKRSDALYLLIWGLTPICVMSLAKSRLSWYVLLSCPAFAIMTAIFVNDVVSAFFKKSMYLMGVPCAVSCIFLYNQVAYVLNTNTKINNHPIKKLVYEMKKDENKTKTICIYDEYKETLTKRKNEFEKFYYSQIKANVIEMKEDDVEKMVNENKCNYYIFSYSHYSSLIKEKAASFMVIPKVKNTKKDLVIISLDKNDKLLPTLVNENKDIKVTSNGNEVTLPFIVDRDSPLTIEGGSSCVLETTFKDKHLDRYAGFFINDNEIKIDFFRKIRMKVDIPYRSFYLQNNKKDENITIYLSKNSRNRVLVDLKCNAKEYIDELVATQKVLWRVKPKKWVALKNLFITYNYKGKRLL